jgi:hypothetical protein
MKNKSSILEVLSHDELVNLWDSKQFKFLVESMEINNSNAVVLGDSGYTLIKNECFTTKDKQ